MATYTEEMVEQINSVLNGAVEATAENIVQLTEALNVPEKSLGAKLRSMGVTTPKKAGKVAFSEAETEQFIALVDQGLNAQEIADTLGKRIRQIYGKALSLKLHVEAPAKEEYVKKYTPEQEATIATMVEAGSFIEDIAEAFDKSVAQIRGKLLSMKLKAPQKNHKEVNRTVVYTDEIIASVVAMVKAGNTSEEIAESLDLNPRGVKSRIGKLHKEGVITSLPTDMGTVKKGLVDYTPELIAQIEALAAEGYTSADAADHLGIPVASLRSKSGRLGITFSKPEKVSTEE